MRPMSDTHHVKNSTGSIRSSDKIEDAFKKMNVNEDKPNPYPDRPGERDCQFYLRTGLCGYGSTCRFNHPINPPQGNIVYHNEELPERIGQPDCEYYLKTGACKYGSTCKYHHPKDRNGAEPVLFNALSLPMRHGEKPCPYYLRTGTCRFGAACKFHHPQPGQQSNTTSAYGMSMSSFPYNGGGLTMMSTYGTLPRPPPPQVPQSYVPIMVSPPHGLLPPQGWSTYMTASNSMYNVKNQPYYSVSNAPIPMAMTLNGGLPEQQECRFFMNTGTCKYGDDCKYNHPGVRITQPQPSPLLNLLNNFVLPLRPGQPACGNLKSYGFCKFGPNCRFDHSMMTPYTNLTMPLSLPSPYVSSANPRITVLPSHSESKSISNNGNTDVGKEMTKVDNSVVSENSSSPRSGF